MKGTVALISLGDCPFSDELEKSAILILYYNEEQTNEKEEGDLYVPENKIIYVTSYGNSDICNAELIFLW